MATGTLADPIYFILIDDEPVDWTPDLDTARKRTDADNRRYVRYSYDPLDRKPFERITPTDHQTLGDSTQARSTTNEQHTTGSGDV